MPPAGEVRSELSPNVPSPELMKMRKYFTLDDVRRVNRDLISGSARNLSGLSPAGRRVVQESRFSREEINRAFAEALRVVLR